tara:strand:- start:2670 stop:2837 length:168 start_codon:yes stop_codon:yes gene_type:complete
LPVDNPAVVSPNDLTVGRPLNAITIASPELAVLFPVIIAILEASFFRTYDFQVSI